MVLTVVVPLTTIIAVLVGVRLHAGVVDRRTEEIKDLIESRAERYDANLLRFENGLLARLRGFERCAASNLARTPDNCCRSDWPLASTRRSTFSDSLNSR